MSESPHNETLEEGGHGEEILLVDDEIQVLSMVRGMLEDLGYVVTVCEDGAQGLEMFQVNPDRFSLVITDQTMPHKTGVELAQSLHAIRPEVPIILATGFSHVISDQNFQEFGIFTYLKKPVDFGELERTVREALNTYRSESYATDTGHG